MNKIKLYTFAPNKDIGNITINLYSVDMVYCENNDIVLVINGQKYSFYCFKKRELVSLINMALITLDT